METGTDALDRVKLFTLSIQSHINQFNDNTSRFIILALVITAILQVIVTQSDHGLRLICVLGLLSEYSTQTLFFCRRRPRLLWYLHCFRSSQHDHLLG